MNNGTMSRTCHSAVTVTALTFALSAPNPASAAINYDTRALTGEAAPGTDPGVVYSSLGTPVLNGHGQVAFKGDLTGTGVDSTNNTGIWSEGGGSLDLLARAGSAAPGTEPGVVYSSFNNPAFNGAGQTAFRSTLTGTSVDSTNDVGIWSDTPGTLSLFVRSGDAAPGTEPGVVYSGFNRHAFNEAGQIAFTGTLTGSGGNITNSKGIWSGGMGSLALVVRAGDAAPGTEPGVVYSGFVIFGGSPAFNGAGQTAFTGILNGPGVDSTNDAGIWSEGSGSLNLIARTGDIVPGMGPGEVFRDLILFNPVLNGAGQTAFTARIFGNDRFDYSIWVEDSGSLNLVAREGDAAPGTEPGVVFGLSIFTFEFSEPVLNGAGQTAFVGFLSGPGVGLRNDSGIWSEGSGSLSLIARAGDAAPGTEPGVVFDNFHLVNFFADLVLNGAGQTAFLGNLTGQYINEYEYANVDGTNDQGLWATDPSGVLTLIARTGDQFDVNDDPLIDDMRTISLINLHINSGGEDGRPNSFNDAGQLAFNLSFTDGTSGIFVASFPLTGDLNGDGFVGIADLNAVIGNWNQNVTPGDPLAGDATGDGFVGIEDLNTVLGNWNAGTPPGAPGAGALSEGSAIPEPGTLAMFVGVLGALTTRRK